MGHVISDLSKYVITVFMIIYTLECFVAVATKKEHERGGVYIRQIICMFMVHFLGFAAICLETEDVSYIIFYGFQQILLFATIALFRVAYPEADKLVINNMCMLLTISFIMLTRISYQKSIRQFIIVAVSLIIGLFIPFLVSKLKFLKHLTWIYGMVGVFALLVVAVLGSVTHGSKISYSINGFTFQPSEFVKILFVFFIAGLLTESKSLGQVVISAVAAAAHVIILVFSKDLGSAVIFFAGYLIMVFIATKNLTTSQAGWNAVNGGYSYTYNMAPTGEQTVQFKSVQPDSREQIVISAPGFSNATIAVDNYLAANIGVSGELRAVYNGLTYTLQSRSATSSNTSIINNFTTNRRNMYNITVKSGNKLSDTVTITCYGYTGSFTVGELLTGMRLNLYQ